MTGDVGYLLPTQGPSNVHPGTVLHLSSRVFKVSHVQGIPAPSPTTRNRAQTRVPRRLVCARAAACSPGPTHHPEPFNRTRPEPQATA